MALQKRPQKILGRLVKLLELLANSESPITLRHASERLNINKPSLLRLFNFMKDEGLASQSQGIEGYILGPKLLYWGASYLKKTNLLSIVQDKIRTLGDKCNETVAFCILNNLVRIVLAVHLPSRNVRTDLDLGLSIPLPYGAGGKVITAFLEENIRERIFSKPSHLSSKITPVHFRGALKREIHNAQKSFIAFSNSEMKREIQAMASPVFNYQDKVIGSVSVICPSYRYQALSPYKKDLINVAREISSQMGSKMKFPEE